MTNEIRAIESFRDLDSGRSKALAASHAALVDVNRQISEAADDAERRRLFARETYILRALYSLYSDLEPPGWSLMPDISWVRFFNLDPNTALIGATARALGDPSSHLPRGGRLPWPDGFAPSDPGVHVHAVNSMRIPYASPKRVLDALLDASSWPEHYINIEPPDLGGEPRLRDGSVFTLRTFGSTFEARAIVREGDDVSTVAWSAKGPMAQVFHRWDIYPMAGVGSVVTTEETQRGAGPWLSSTFQGVLPSLRLQRSMQIAHFLWLLGLRAKLGNWGALGAPHSSM